MRSSSYTPSQKLLHWSIFLLVIGLYALTYGEDIFPRGDPRRDTAWWLHISFGLALFGLVAVRVAMRLAYGAPELPASMSGLERKLARVAHLALYLLLVAIPVLGIWLTWLRGDALTFFGWFTVPSPMTPDRELAHTIKEVHGVLANIILAVVALHAAAALLHHFVRRDDVLKRMLPGG